MTASQSCKSVRRVCCLLTSHDTARPDIRLSLQIVQPLLEFDPREGTWRWDIDRICAKGFTDNLPDLMTGKLKRLPVVTQKALKQLACLGNSAEITLVWGVPLIPGGAVVTAELADHAVDQCELLDGRFTLVAPDAYRGDFLEVKLFSARGQELARESLYADE